MTSFFTAGLEILVKENTGREVLTELLEGHRKVGIRQPGAGRLFHPAAN